MLAIHPSSRFRRSFKRMPVQIQDDFEKRISLFQEHPFHPSLNTHKLGGRLKEFYAFYLRDGYRVLFDFVARDMILLINIGSHDDYQKWSKTG